MFLYRVVLMSALLQISSTVSLNNSDCGRIWITIHASNNFCDNIDNSIELNWDFTGCKTKPRTIGLFKSRPTNWEFAVVMYPLKTVEGKIVTCSPLGEMELPAGWSTGKGKKGMHCLWPWVGAGNTEILFENCFKIQPTWMEHYSDKINGLCIGELVIPGTHNSGAWRSKKEIGLILTDQATICQDRDIWGQLVFGIRYFDFRIGFYPDNENEDNRYWLNHDLIPIHPLLPALKQLRAFLDYTKEVVFIDIHRFPVGFENSPDSQSHLGLLQLIQKQLGPHFANANLLKTYDTLGPTLQTFIDINKRLLFSYAHREIVERNPWLWPKVEHLWPKTNNPKNVLQKIDQFYHGISKSDEHSVISSKSNLHAAMAQVTPELQDIFLFPGGSLRRFADELNREISKRLAYRWKYKANIICTDFFLGNDVIDLSIILTVQRAQMLRKGLNWRKH